MLEEKNNQEVKYGSCFARVIALLLDDCIIGLFIGMPLFAVVSVMYVMMPVDNFYSIDDLHKIYMLLCGCVVIILVFTMPIIYTVTLVASKKQSTFAMRWFNLIIVDKNMQRLSLWHSFGRCVVSGLVNFFTGGLGYLTALFREDKRGLHDIICETYVIYK